ncbi:sec-independent protein translocase protein TATB, chloroplastic isoform X3 [Lotus japonicus]|uniref:sec-independent protein translocase protein TATB, chloroplastic isoform X3 n=1 Tax=Lotus japonicus TaxID=34305 RepID=UPI002586FB55|nr:sec-independent protein translocase protein TATB, chloroplastic isoform X3 [Lotus japonicus]
MTQSLAMVSSTVLCPKLGACAVSLSPSATPHTKIQRFHLSSWLSPMGRSLFSPWNGLKHLGISTKPKPLFHIDRKGRCKGKLVYASLFGVGAPEALVIGVVALLVFGPKGLAEVARNLGKTLRTFQPTIRELQDVSREFKSTLEREIGLDDISSPTQNPYNSNFQNTTSTPSSTDSTKSSPIAVDPGQLVSHRPLPRCYCYEVEVRSHIHLFPTPTSASYNWSGKWNNKRSHATNGSKL